MAEKNRVQDEAIQNVEKRFIKVSLEHGQQLGKLW